MTHRRSALVLLVALVAGCGSRAVPEVRCVDGWCALPAGSFSNYFSPGHFLGVRQGWSVNYPRYLRLTRGFEIAQSETTQASYYDRLGLSLPPGAEPTLPITGLSWHTAAAYCNALSIPRGLEQCYRCTSAAGDPDSPCETAAGYEGRAIYACRGYRLPTVAEWIYAYRAGTETFFYNGTPAVTLESDRPIGPPNPAIARALERFVEPIGWHVGNSGGRLQPTMRKQPNAWGLFDMAGNAAEWAHDQGLEHRFPASHYPSHGKRPDPTVTPEIDPIEFVPVKPGGQDRVALMGATFNSMPESLNFSALTIPLRDKRLSHATVRCVRTLPDTGP